MQNKTVYILGAGSSVTAKLPTQNRILQQIFSIRETSFDQSFKADNIMTIHINKKLQNMYGYYRKFEECRQEVGAFIVHSFLCENDAKMYDNFIGRVQSINEIATVIDVKEKALKKASLDSAYEIVNKSQVSLEDIFTLFDNVYSGREHFKLYSPERMADIHHKFKLCIIYAFSFAIAKDCNRRDYNKFCQFLINKRSKSRQKDDIFSIITTNWDDVLESSLNDLCTDYNNQLTKYKKRIYPDLCFYDYSLSKNSNDHIPSTHIKAKGQKNIKVLKMHGSIAWLECPRCGRIFTDFSEEIADKAFVEETCPYCSLDEISNEANPLLRELIITPTFMKSFDNLNIKNIWHSAFMDISEANHLVFIGYSFPDADFEMRCMLKKALKSNVDVEVILSKYDSPQYFRDELNNNISDDKVNSIIDKMNLPEKRFKSFFESNNISFNYCGFSSYVDNMEEL